jgi:hypothetical protein
MSNKLVILQNGILINFETNDSDINFILLQRRFNVSCIIFKLRIRVIHVSL